MVVDIEPKKAYGYIRVSTDEQAGESKVSLPTQRRDIIQFAEQAGFKLEEIFEDVGSGTDPNRPGFIEMLNRLRRDGGGIIICWLANRLCRGTITTAPVLEVMYEFDVEVLAVRETITPDSFEFNGVMSGRDLAYIRMRNIMGREGKAWRGKIPGNRICYGYTTNGKGDPLLNEETATVVEYIYQLAVDKNLATPAIANRLNLEKIPSPRQGIRGWTPNTVRNILRHAAYKGVWYYRKKKSRKISSGIRVTKRPEEEWIAVPVPAIVCEERWQAAQELLSQRLTRSPRNTKTFYLLQSLMHCSECGRMFGAKRETGQRALKRSVPHRFYLCYGIYYDKTECRLPRSIRADRIEPFIWNQLVDIILEPDVFIRKLEARSLDPHSSEELAVRIREAERALADQDRSAQRVIDLYADEGITRREFDKFMAKARERQDHYGRILADLKQEERTGALEREQKNRFRDWTAQIRSHIDDLTDEQRREIVQSTVSRIDIDGSNNITMTVSWEPDSVAITNKSLRKSVSNSDTRLVTTLTTPLPPRMPTDDEIVASEALSVRRLGKNTRLRRNALGLSLEDLGERLGISGRTINSLEGGYHLSPSCNVELLADHLGVDAKTLLEGDVYSPSNYASRTRLPDAIRRTIRTSGMSVEEMIASTGVSGCALNRWESGEALPSLPDLIRLSCLGVTLSDLLPPRPDTPVTLGQHILRRRRELGLTQGEQAQLLDVNWGALSGWERDLRLPKPVHWDKLSEFLEFDVSALVSRIEDAVVKDTGPNSLGSHIRMRRNEMGLTVEEFASLAGVTRYTITNWERRKSWPETQHYAALSKVLECDVEKIVREVRTREIAGVAPRFLGDYIRLRRYQLELSQVKLANQLVVNVESVGFWERGRRMPHPRYHEGLMKFLGMSFTRHSPRAEQASTFPIEDMSLGALIRKKRKGMKLTQPALAEVLGVERNAIGNWELGNTFPRTRLHIDILSEWLGIEVTTLKGITAPTDNYRW